MRVNPRNRKVKAPKPRRRYLNRPDQIAALLTAAGQLDDEARFDRKTGRRPLIAVLVYGGLRIGEALDLRWRDVDLPGRRLRLQHSKTDAGVRDVPMVPALVDELLSHRAARSEARPDSRVFCTRSGGALTKDNTRQRVLHRAVERADEILDAAGRSPLPQNLTQHSLRHTYISLRLALGDDPAAVAQDAGHADMSVTFRVSTHVMRLVEEDRKALRELVDGTAMPELRPLGRPAQGRPSERVG